MHHDVIISFSLSACYSSAGFRYSHIHILHPTVVRLLLGLGKESHKTVQEMESKEPGGKFLRSLFWEKEILDLTYRPIVKNQTFCVISAFDSVTTKVGSFFSRNM